MLVLIGLIVLSKILRGKVGDIVILVYSEIIMKTFPS